MRNLRIRPSRQLAPGLLLMALASCGGGSNGDASSTGAVASTASSPSADDADATAASPVSGTAASSAQASSGSSSSSSSTDATSSAGDTALANASVVAAAASGSTSTTASASTSASQIDAVASAALIDVTAAIVADQNVVLAGDSFATLPSGTTTYGALISGKGTLLLKPANSSAASTLIVTQSSNFTLPDDRLVETGRLTYLPHYAVELTGHNPPAVTVSPGVTLQLGVNGSPDNWPLFFSYDDAKNSTSTIRGQVNLLNILNNGTILFNSGYQMRMGEISGSGNLVQLPGAWGNIFMAGLNSFTGVLYVTTQGVFGTAHVQATLSAAKAVINEGTWVVSAPPGGTTTVPQDIYEPHYGDDINFGGAGRVIMSGVYGYTDNSPYHAPNLVNPGLSDASLNTSVVANQGGANRANGHDSSYRGINIESGYVQWGDGTHHRFFLPSAPSPAVVYPPLGAKNAYINLHNGSTLAFNYDGPVTLNVGITGGGGGPKKDDSLAGTGNVIIVGTTGNDVTFAQPQNYNGTTTVEAGATLRVGSGVPVPLNAVNFNTYGIKGTTTIGTYTGDSSLLTAQSSNGVSTDAIVDNGAIIVQNTSTAIALSNISGIGSFTQAGAATTTLTNNNYSGTTTISAGTLLAGSANAFGTGSVVNGASLALASAQHELMVSGSFQQSSHGGLTLSIAGTSKGVDQDHLTVAGGAVLNGALTLNFATPPTSGQKYVLIDAAGGISGSFSSIVSSGAKVTGGHDAKSYYVTVQ